MRTLVVLLTLLAGCEIAHPQQAALRATPDAGDDTDPEQGPCEPGTSKSCFCAIGEPQGERQCRDNGSGWQPCECAVAAADSGAPADAGEADASVDRDAGPQHDAGELWQVSCEAQEDCNGYVDNPSDTLPDSIALACVTTTPSRPGKRCTFACRSGANAGAPCQEACEYAPCTALGGSCQQVESGGGSFFACISGPAE